MGAAVRIGRLHAPLGIRKGQGGIGHDSQFAIHPADGRCQAVRHVVISVGFFLRQLVEHHIADKGAALLPQRHSRQGAALTGHPGVGDEAAGGTEQERLLHVAVIDPDTALIPLQLGGDRQPAVAVQRGGNKGLLLRRRQGQHLAVLVHHVQHRAAHVVCHCLAAAAVQRRGGHIHRRGPHLAAAVIQDAQPGIRQHHQTVPQRREAVAGGGVVVIDGLAARLFHAAVIQIAAQRVKAGAVPVGGKYHHAQYSHQRQEEDETATQLPPGLLLLVFSVVVVPDVFRRISHCSVARPHTKVLSGTVRRGARWGPPAAGRRSPEWRGCPRAGICPPPRRARCR